MQGLLLCRLFLDGVLVGLLVEVELDGDKIARMALDHAFSAIRGRTIENDNGRGHTCVLFVLGVFALFAHSGFRRGRAFALLLFGRQWLLLWCLAALEAPYVEPGLPFDDSPAPLLLHLTFLF